MKYFLLLALLLCVGCQTTKPTAPPPYNLGLPIGAAALFAALVWFFL